MPHDLRIGVDLGGSKIASVALDRDGRMLAERRSPTPSGDYGGVIAAIADHVAALEGEAGGRGTVGIGMPGSISPATGLVQNANSIWLNGRDFGGDVERALGRPVRLANDANCFALSEAADGAARGTHVVFGVIIGTGCGGGIVVAGRPILGRHHVSGEWGHNPLPWAEPSEYPGPACWCGRKGCLELWVSGSGLERDHLAATGERATAVEIETAAGLVNGAAARASLERHAERLARGLAHVVNIIDPDVIVLGGGLSSMAHLYVVLPGLIAPHVFADHCRADIRPPAHGDASGARGAARLWREAELV